MNDWPKNCHAMWPWPKLLHCTMNGNLIGIADKFYKEKNGITEQMLGLWVHDEAWVLWDVAVPLTFALSKSSCLKLIPWQIETINIPLNFELFRRRLFYAARLFACRCCFAVALLLLLMLLFSVVATIVHVAAAVVSVAAASAVVTVAADVVVFYCSIVTALVHCCCCCYYCWYYCCSVLLFVFLLLSLSWGTIAARSSIEFFVP